MVRDVFDSLKAANRLPSPAGVALRVLELARSPDSSVVDVADAVRVDPALAARILKFVNSPMVGLPQKVSSLRQGVSLIGMRAAQMMALSFSLVSSEDKTSCPNFDYGRFWSRSLACGVAARIIARATRKHDAEEAFTAGLLSRIGQLVLACGLPSEYESIIRQAADSDETLVDVEERVLNTNHFDIGARLVADWQLPLPICESIAAFHLVYKDHDQDISPLGRIVYVSNLVAELLCDNGMDAAAQRVANAMDRYFRIDAGAWDELLQTITEQWRQYGELLAIDTAKEKSFTDMQAEASERIAELSLATQLENQMVKERNAELTKKAATDQLTGLANRAAFDDRLIEELDRAMRFGRPVGLLMIDIDHFKRCNDTYGHQAGDGILRGVAKIIQTVARKIDFVARYGGEEFVVIAPECPEKPAAALAERIRATIERTAFTWQKEPIRLTISAGIAVAQWPDNGRMPEEIIAVADERLYAAKQAGRNCCRTTSCDTAGANSLQPAQE